MFSWVCPACKDPLQYLDSSWICGNGHNYDRAKSGYVNLLLAQHKSSKQPGDSKEMLLARRDFLNAGYYQIIADSVAVAINQLPVLSKKDGSMHLLDCGCGEGYYLQQIARTLTNSWLYAGIDISKTAVELAAKRKLHHATWVCASNRRLPLADNSVDVALRVFSPQNDQELSRVLTGKGFLIVVTPAQNHLIEIRSTLYEKITPHEKPAVPIGFELVAQHQVNKHLSVQTNQSVTQLLSMTPFFWNGSQQARDSLLKQELLSVTIDVLLSIYQVKTQASS